MWWVAGRTYYISNAAVTGWRPAVKIKLYRDTSCTSQISADLVGCSGNNPGAGTCSNALDNSATKWRPNCEPCSPDQAWITLTTAEQVLCINATNFGVGEGGGKSWSGGIKVKESLDGPEQVMQNSNTWVQGTNYPFTQKLSNKEQKEWVFECLISDLASNC